jgi:exopolyphosphatase/guanosine-5'-triphosphate,3'-diphosphate pyrophosphatase
MASDVDAPPRSGPYGLAHWMRRVLRECERAGRAMSPDAVHDLRVALRRCRSIARSLTELDPHPDWRRMRKAGKRLFRSFGELRDTQVMVDWVTRLAPADDPVRQRMLEVLAGRERELTAHARVIVTGFDRARWKRFATTLPERARRLAPDSPVFEHLALERCREAHDLHRRALRDRSRIGYHRLRIGLKRFRYTIENFLPALHVEWEADLKGLQDQLGELHDLDVLWARLPRALRSVFDAPERARWREWIDAERRRRIEEYRRKTLGKDSLWSRWQTSLPHGDRLEPAALAKLAAWASFRDPSFGDKPRVARWALDLFEQMAAAGVPGPFGDARARRILRAAAIVHDAGRMDGKKGHHTASYRAIRALAPPLGWSRDDVELLALVARYHRGAPPRPDQAVLRAIDGPARTMVLQLAGLLRLALALAGDTDSPDARVTVTTEREGIVIAVDGAANDGPLAAEVLRRKWLLELACGRSVIVRFGGPGSLPPEGDATGEARLV